MEQAHKIDNLGKRIAEIREQFGLPGLAAAHLITGRTSEYCAGVRRAGASAAIKEGDRWHIGSCAKSMTATLVAVAISRNLLRWDTTVADAFAELKLTISPAFSAVTVAMLASHTSGITGGMTDAYGNLWKSLWEPQLESVAGRGLVLHRILSQKPKNLPGQNFEYSNWNYILLGALIDRCFDKPWEEVIRREIFAPLAMITCGFGPPAVEGETTPSQPWFHSWADGQWQPVEPGFRSDNPPTMNPAGRVHCSLSDWFRYIELHIDGAKGRKTAILAPDDFTVLHRPIGPAGYTAGGWLSLSCPWSKGRVLHHAGSNTVAFANLWIAPAEERAFAAVTNCGKTFDTDPHQATDTAIWAMINAFMQP